MKPALSALLLIIWSASCVHAHPETKPAEDSQNTFLNAILILGEDWQVAASGYQATDALASNLHGDVLFRDLAAKKTYKIAPDGKITEDFVVDGESQGLAFSALGHLYAANAVTGKILFYDAPGTPTTVADGIHPRNLVVTNTGNIYVTDTGAGESDSGKVWLVNPTIGKSLLDSGLNHPSGIALSPDGLWLAVLENKTHWGYSYRVKPDGTLEDKQRFYWLHVPDGADDSGAGGSCMDSAGRLYVATRMGVQVLDRNGRTRAILPIPGGEVTSVCFGGTKFDILFATAGGKVYQRKLQVPGAPPWAAPIKLPPGGGG